METLKALTAWMAEITHLVATGPSGMTAETRQRLDGHIKTVQSEAKRAEEAGKRWRDSAVEIQGETVEFEKPAATMTQAPPLEGAAPAADPGPATPEPSPTGETAAGGTGDPAPAELDPAATEKSGAEGEQTPAPATETAPKSTGKPSAKA